MFAEDLVPFFSTKDFAVQALYDGTTSVAGIFDRSPGDLPDGLGLQEARPRFLCPRGSLPGDPHRKTLVIDGVSYVIAAVDTDGAGVASLSLVKAP